MPSPFLVHKRFLFHFDLPSGCSSSKVPTCAGASPLELRWQNDSFIQLRKFSKASKNKLRNSVLLVGGIVTSQILVKHPSESKSGAVKLLRHPTNCPLRCISSELRGISLHGFPCRSCHICVGPMHQLVNSEHITRDTSRSRI